MIAALIVFLVFGVVALRHTAATAEFLKKGARAFGTRDDYRGYSEARIRTGATAFVIATPILIAVFIWGIIAAAIGLVG